MIQPRIIPALAPALAATALLAACDPLTDDDYRGEALFALEGKVANRRVLTPSDVNLYLLWASPDDLPNVAEQLEIMPTFPATFQMSVFDEPRVQSTSDEDHPPPRIWSRLTIGHIVAATSDANFQEYMAFPASHRDPGILGVDPRHMLYFVPDGVPAGSVTAGILHGTLEPGFHVFDVKCIGPAKAAEIRACLADYRANGGAEELGPMLDACGSVNPNVPWLQLAPDDLQTELTVELIDDLPSWQPDPSECL